MTSLPINDRGLLLGDGVFETLLAKAGVPVLFNEHLFRMQSAAAALGLPPPNEQSMRDLVELALSELRPGTERAAVRVTYTAGSGGRGLERPRTLNPRLLATAVPSDTQLRAATLRTSSIRRNPTSPAARLKTLAYLDNVEARRQALAEGADEALMLETTGAVASAAAANIFWIRDEVLITPPANGAILPGIMRAKVLDAASQLRIPILEVSTTPDHLARCSGMFLTNSLIGIRPVAALDGRTITPHPLVSRLTDAIGEWV